MDYSVGDGAICIALFQTVAGQELSVHKSLVKTCRDKEIDNYVFFKALGSFDIIMLYFTPDFDSFIPEIGSIPGILKSNILFCYCYSDNDPNTFFNKLKKSSCIGLSLLKINPEALKTGSWLLKAYQNHLLSQDSDRLLFGSIGWSEMILVTTKEDVNIVAKGLLNASLAYVKTSKTPVLIKTFSVIGINYIVLPTPSVFKSGFKKVQAYMARVPFMERTVIEPQNSKALPIIEVSNEPMYTHSIRKYFRKHGFTPYDLCGTKDMCFVPSTPMTWGDLLSSVMFFRNRFQDKVFSTNIRLRLDALNRVSKLKKTSLKPKLFSIPHDDLEKKFGKAMASSLANHFHFFNTLLQNPICGNAFKDMYLYPQYVVEKGLAFQKGFRELAHAAREVLKYGSELRSYGTFETIEEVTGKFSELRGGGQRALLAIEYLPRRILEDSQILWKGFVISNPANKFLHINQVIQVPTDSLWKPQKWWALYHEIAHIFIDHHQDWVDYEHGPLHEFIAEKRFREAWIKLTMELAAEIIGFEMGFFGDYKLFFKLFWEHIEEIDTNIFGFEHYALRSFFLELFLARFTEIKEVPEVSECEFRSIDFVYDKFVQHLDTIEGYTGRCFPNKYVVAAENAKTVVELYSFAELLSAKILKSGLRISRQLLENRNTIQIVKKLKQGTVWWGHIDCPQAVMYHFLNPSKLSFRVRTAILLTFWYHQMRLMEGAGE